MKTAHRQTGAKQNLSISVQTSFGAQWLVSFTLAGGMSGAFTYSVFTKDNYWLYKITCKTAKSTFDRLFSYFLSSVHMKTEQYYIVLFYNFWHVFLAYVLA